MNSVAHPRLSFKPLLGPDSIQDYIGPRPDYYHSDQWQLRRLLVLHRAYYCCQECPSRASHVHHLSYENFTNETWGDLIALCDSCHKAKHPGWDET
jgi:5-methylcytosine-specific restriction endonuclease McrA